MFKIITGTKFNVEMGLNALIENLDIDVLLMDIDKTKDPLELTVLINTTPKEVKDETITDEG